MRKIFKHKRFHEWCLNERISNFELIKAVKEIENGLFEANLGSGLYKKRIARSDSGKRDGYRILLAYKNYGVCLSIIWQQQRNNYRYY